MVPGPQGTEARWRLLLGTAAFVVWAPPSLLGLPLAGLLLATRPRTTAEWGAAGGVGVLSAGLLLLPATDLLTGFVRAYTVLVTAAFVVVTLFAGGEETLLARAIRAGLIGGVAAVVPARRAQSARALAGAVPRISLRRPLGVGDHRGAAGLDHARRRRAQAGGAEPPGRARRPVPGARHRDRRRVRRGVRDRPGGAGHRRRGRGGAGAAITVAVTRPRDPGHHRHVARIPAPPEDSGLNRQRRGCDGDHSARRRAASRGGRRRRQGQGRLRPQLPPPQGPRLRRHRGQ